MAESYLKDLKKQLPCAVYLNGEHNTKEIYAERNNWVKRS